MLLAHIVIGLLAVGGSPPHHAAASGGSDGLLMIGLLLGILPGMVFGMLVGRLADRGGGRGRGRWWRFWKPRPKQPGPLPTGGNARPAPPRSGEPAHIPDHVPPEWTERYLPDPIRPREAVRSIRLL